VSYPALSGLTFSSKPELELVIIMLFSFGRPVTPVQLWGRSVGSV